MADGSSGGRSDPNAPRYGERPPQAPPFVQGVGQPRYGMPDSNALRNEVVPAWRQSWPKVVTVIGLVVLVTAMIVWWQLS